MVTDEILAAGLVGDIGELIEGWEFPDDTHLLLEQQPMTATLKVEERQDLLLFTKFDASGEKSKIKQATSGRIFHEDFELRWEKSEQGYQAVYLGVKRVVPGLTLDQETLRSLTKHSKSKYYLFGTVLDTQKVRIPNLQKDGAYFAEVRIPRPLHYPIKSNGRVRLQVCEYTDDQTGQVQLFRFQGLEAASL